MTTLPFADMLMIIEDRSAALRAAAAEAGLDGRVPGCPDWTVADLVTHLGGVHRFWAAAVSAGPAAGPPGDDQLPGTAPSRDLLTWSAAATGELVGALASAGPDRPCWTWWRSTSAPATSGAVARHQVQEAGVHAFDAQEAAGHSRPLPPGVAGDGIGEFVTVGMAALGAWPHQGGTVALAPDDGTTWLVTLTSDGATAVPAGPQDGLAAPVPAGPQDGSATPDTRIRGTGSDIVLALYGRQARRGLIIEGDRDLATRLFTWATSE